MVAWMDREALERDARDRPGGLLVTVAPRLWRKGEESGNVQTVREIRTDCDGDVVLLKVEQAGGIACHTGRHSCFFNVLDRDRDGRPQWKIVEPVLEPPRGKR